MKTICPSLSISCLMIRNALLCFACLLTTLEPALADPRHPCEVDTIRRAAPGTTFHLYKSGTSTTLSYDGKITFTDDERDIKSITPGGYFRYSKTTFGNKREIFIQSAWDGTLRRKYFTGKSEVAYEPEGRQWLQQMLPEIMATTGLGAEDRIKRIYAKAGLNGALAEISKIDNDYAKSAYYSSLLALPALKNQDLKGVLVHLNSQLDSDQEKSKLLRQIAPRYLQNAKNTQAYLAAVDGLSSDYEKAKVLTYVLQTPAISQTSSELVIPAVKSLRSDYEQAKVLRAVLTQPELSSKAHQEVIYLTRGMASDHEKNRVLHQLIANPNYVRAHFGELLGAINTLQADHEKCRALATLVARQKLSSQQYMQLFHVVSTLESSYDKSRTLQKIRATMPPDNDAVRAAYVKAAKTISSDAEYRKAIAGLE
jgi:hypothetical protein